MAMQEASCSLREVLEGVEVACGGIISQVEAGLRPLDAYRSAEFTSVRDRLFAAQRAFDDAFTAARAEGIRLLVDDEGLSLTEVGRVVGRSRQFVTRLYRRAHADQ